jgi:hypothetical protein
LTFFGLNPEYRKIFKEEIFDLTYFGKGLGSYWDIYHMPIMDRKYNLKLLKDSIEAQKPKDSKNLTLEDMVKKKPLVPDFVAKKTPSTKK